MTQDTQQQGETSPGLIGRMLALFRLLIEAFARAFAEERNNLRRLRNIQGPADWRDHWPALQELEIRIHGLILSGVAQLRATGRVDLLTLTRVDDATFIPTPPSTFEELRARYEAAAAFLADPMPFFQRASERAASPLRLDAAHRPTSPALRTEEAEQRRLASISPQDWGRWIARSRAQDGGGRAFARGPPHQSRFRLFNTSAAPRLRSYPLAYAAMSPSQSRRSDMSARRAA